MIAWSGRPGQRWRMRSQLVRTLTAVKRRRHSWTRWPWGANSIPAHWPRSRMTPLQNSSGLVRCKSQGSQWHSCHIRNQTGLFLPETAQRKRLEITVCVRWNQNSNNTGNSREFTQCCEYYGRYYLSPRLWEFWVKENPACDTNYKQALWIYGHVCICTYV